MLHVKLLWWCYFSPDRSCREARRHVICLANHARRQNHEGCKGAPLPSLGSLWWGFTDAPLPMGEGQGKGGYNFNSFLSELTSLVFSSSFKKDAFAAVSTECFNTSICTFSSSQTC